MKNSFIASTIVGTIVSFFMMYVAWEHNPQCEFHCEETIHFKSLIIVGLLWFVVGFISTLIISRIFNFIYK